MVLLDSMDLATLHEAVRRNNARGAGKAVLEISGGVTLQGHPERTVVVYANTSAEVKAFELQALKADHPNAKVLVHPESPADVSALADAVGSTSAILAAARSMDASTFIVATDNGMLHKLRKQNPGKRFIEAPTAGSSATCKSCAHCPWMAMNSLAGLAEALAQGSNEVHINPALGLRARLPIDRMVAFTAALKTAQTRSGLGAKHWRGLTGQFFGVKTVASATAASAG
jgi:quinolinate synthase